MKKIGETDLDFFDLMIDRALIVNSGYHSFHFSSWILELLKIGLQDNQRTLKLCLQVCHVILSNSKKATEEKVDYLISKIWMIW